MGYSSQFNRLDRDGDYMEGDLQLVEGVSLVEFIDAAGGTRKAAIRSNGNDLEFYDVSKGVWVKLSSLNTGLTTALYERQVTTAAQSVFVLTTGSYVTGIDALHVYVNGTRVPNSYFTEDSATQVTISAPYAPTGSGEIVEFIVAKGIAESAYTSMVSSGDTTPDYLENKIVAGSNITITKLNSGGNETLSIAASTGGGTGANILGAVSGSYYKTHGTCDATVIDYTWPSGTDYLRITGHASGGSDGASSVSCSFSAIIDVSAEEITGGEASIYDDDNAYHANAYNAQAISDGHTLGASEGGSSYEYAPRFYISSWRPSGVDKIVIGFDNNRSSDWTAVGSILVEALG